VYFAFIVAFVFAVMFGGILLFVRGRGYARTLELSLPKSAGMVLPPELSEVVRGRVVAMTVRYIVIAAIVGIAFTVIVPVALWLAPWDLSGAYVGMSGVIVGLVAGHLSVFASDAKRRESNPGPIERPGGVTLLDYLTPFSVIAAIVILVLGFASVALGIYIQVSNFEFDYERTIISSPVASTVSYVAMLLALIAYIVGLAVILRKPQRAESNVALAWDDAATSQLMFAGLYITLFIIAISTNPLYQALVSLVPGGGETDGLRTLLFASSLLVPLLTFALVITSVLIKPNKRYIKRLWPSLAR